MEYSKLNLGQASLVKKEVDLTIQKLNELINSQPTQSEDPMINNSVQQIHYQNYRQKLITSIQYRIDELEQFYLQNSDDERAVLFEKERLRLRKILQNYLNQPTTTLTSVPSSPRDGNSVNRGIPGDSRSFHSSVTGIGGASASQPNRSTTGPTQQQTPQPLNPATTSTNLSLNNTSLHIQTNKSSLSGPNTPNQILSTRKSPTSPTPIYAWEERSSKPPRNTLTIDGIVYEPSSRTGVYKRIGTVANRSGNNSPGADDQAEELGVNLEEDQDEGDNNGNDRYYDFQIVLTQDEITALAARKKKERDDVKLMKSKAAATSIHTAVPYVDPRRIKLDMLRPGHPDRWIHPDGMK